MSIDEEHRGRGLGLWMISIADAMYNSEMSLCILKPFPLQHERVDDSSAAAKARFRVDLAKLSAYYERIGLKAWNHSWLYRWNGYEHPRLLKTPDGYRAQTLEEFTAHLQARDARMQQWFEELRKNPLGFSGGQ
jgi:hypothetical protein